MAFGNYQNNDKKTTKSKNTRGYQFYDEDVFGSTLALGFWNSTLTMKIHPLLPENKRSNNSKYDYESFVNVALTPQKLFAFLSGVKNIAISIANGIYSFKSVGVPAGSGFVEVAPSTKYGGPENSVAICIYNGIDESGKPSDKLIFQFSKSNYFENYDPENNGAFDKSNDLEVDFALFCNTLEEQFKASSMAQAHAGRYAAMYTDESLMGSLKSIKEKLGIESPSYGNKGGGNSTSYFGASKNDDKGNSANYGAIDNGGTVYEDRLPEI